MRIEFEFENEFEVTARMEGLTPSILHEIAISIDVLTPELGAFIVEQKLSGQVLNKITGKLQESIKPQPVVQASDAIVGEVLQDNSIADYGRVHEWGADIPTRQGNPMRWIGQEGEPVFRFMAKGFTLPERSFMRSALEDFAPRIEDVLLLAIAKGIGESNV